MCWGSRWTHDSTWILLCRQISTGAHGNSMFRPHGRRIWKYGPPKRSSEKAQAGVAAPKSANIPNITAYARHSYQDGVPFLVRNFATVGFILDWDVFDFGKRRSAVREREAQLAQAEENLRRLKEIRSR